MRYFKSVLDAGFLILGVTVHTCDVHTNVQHSGLYTLHTLNTLNTDVVH